MKQRNYCEIWAGKWFADHDHINDLSDESLSRAFDGCVVPPEQKFYPGIRTHIEQLAMERGLLKEGQLTLF